MPRARSIEDVEREQRAAGNARVEKEMVRRRTVLQRFQQISPYDLEEADVEALEAIVKRHCPWLAS